uniref:Uncharacterized protein n=1 Tax=Alexandrium monilatum TaxID=311494 RepID=A0A7S4Q8W6_9DINO|mmetsp:Transcript_103118/g.327864  ORF Transcript_103118/g.327864 Transcript_103118/m.327864 type:complete len:502 (+) Transcript_103118:283-1788(+)
MDGATPGFGSCLDSDAAYPVPGEDGGWGQTLKLSGDFYGEVDDVHRGVSMPAAPPDMEWGCSDAFGGIECYREPDDILRGIHMDVGHPELHWQDQFDMACLGGLPASLEKGGSASTATGGAVPVSSRVARRFAESDRPPLAPSDPLFQFAAKALRLHSTAPFEIGNILLDFLATQVKSSIIKVAFAKFAIKSEVFLDGASCLLKARAYEEAVGRFCVELQRRGGDCVTFGRVHAMAVHYLTERLPTSPLAADVPEFPKVCPPGIEIGSVDAEGATPLLDMADDSSRPDLQADSAASLLGIAQNKMDVRCLCNARAFYGLKKLLLQSEEDKIAIPTSCTLSALAQHAEATPCFANEGILPIIADKIRSTATSEIVQQELAKALHTTLASCATALSAKVSEEVLEALVDATEDAHIGSGAIRSSLLEARSLLERRHVGALGPLPGEATVVQCGGPGLAAEGPCPEVCLPPSQPPAHRASPVQPRTPSPSPSACPAPSHLWSAP